jgi:hypothetical protein
MTRDTLEPPIPLDAILLTPDDAAHMIGVSPETLTDWRWRDMGPPFVRIGRGPRGRVRYPADALRAWCDALPRHRSTAEYDTKAPNPHPRKKKKKKEAYEEFFDIDVDAILETCMQIRADIEASIVSMPCDEEQG